MAITEKEMISRLSMEAILENMGIATDSDELSDNLKAVRPDYKEDEIDYELFVRVVALSLELRNFTEKEAVIQEGAEEDLD